MTSRKHSGSISLITVAVILTTALFLLFVGFASGYMIVAMKSEFLNRVDPNAGRLPECTAWGLVAQPTPPAKPWKCRIPQNMRPVTEDYEMYRRDI